MQMHSAALWIAHRRQWLHPVDLLALFDDIFAEKTSGGGLAPLPLHVWLLECVFLLRFLFLHHCVSFAAVLARIVDCSSCDGKAPGRLFLKANYFRGKFLFGGKLIILGKEVWTFPALGSYLDELDVGSAHASAFSISESFKIKPLYECLWGAPGALRACLRGTYRHRY